eukprot:g11508.t1
MAMPSVEPSPSLPEDGPALSAKSVSTFPEDWEDDEHVTHCKTCNKSFGLINRKHHCRNCGSIFCGDCTKNRTTIKEKNYKEPVRVCGRCFFTLTKDPYRQMSPNLQLKAQITAMEEVSQALSQENRQLRALVENLQNIVGEQNLVIERLWKQDQLNRREIKTYKQTLTVQGGIGARVASITAPSQETISTWTSKIGRLPPAGQLGSEVMESL